MKRTMITWMLAGTMLATTAAACGSDDDKKPSTTEATSGTEADGGDSGSSSGNADVDKFCADAQDVADQLKKVLADPTSGDMNALLTKSQELAAQAASLATSIAGDAAASQKVNECSQALANAATGG